MFQVKGGETDNGVHEEGVPGGLPGDGVEGGFLGKGPRPWWCSGGGFGYRMCLAGG
jgi:hypothetical protein